MGGVANHTKNKKTLASRIPKNEGDLRPKSITIVLRLRPAPSLAKNQFHAAINHRQNPNFLRKTVSMTIHFYTCYRSR